MLQRVLGQRRFATFISLPPRRRRRRGRSLYSNTNTIKKYHTTMSTSRSSPTAVVNLLDMASAVLASAVSASESIRAFAEPITSSDGGSTAAEDHKNARLKDDGSFVTDADFCAQSIITRAVQGVSDRVRILGEENPEGVAQVMMMDDNDKLLQKHTSISDQQKVYERCRREIYLRYRNRPESDSRSQSEQAVSGSSLPLAADSEQGSTDEPATTDNSDGSLLFSLSEEEEKEIIVDASRVCVIIDPLDGTSSYAKGKYDAVSVLISVNLDFQPHFGVICKPFGYEGVSSILDTKCVAVYGGPLIGAGYLAGGEPLKKFVSSPEGSNAEDLPRAVISSSRSKGVVEDVCRHLGSIGVLYPEPMHISGAGEKSLRLVLRQQNEALWFFPRGGTSLWDIAASDAILRSIGGKVTDKFGRQLDYSKSREEAENTDGIIACSSEKLHAECMRIFQENNWEE